MIEHMNTAPHRSLTGRNQALIALATACLLWGTSVPLSKTALTGFGPAWLTVIRFTVAGLALLVAFRPRLRGNVTLKTVLWGALGYGGCIALQNAGLARTSVTHAALLIGAVPVLVAILAVCFESAQVSLTAWIGFVLSLGGIALVASTGGGDASLGGDALVLLSVLVSAGFTLVQTRLLTGSDVVAVSTVQFLAAALAVLPVAVLMEGSPLHSASAAVPSASVLLAVAALAIIGTVLPYTLFAFGQTGAPSHIAGAFLNLETLVATMLGITLFGEPVTAVQVVGAVGLLAGIYLSTATSVESASVPALEPVLDSVPELAHRPVLQRVPGGRMDGRSSSDLPVWDADRDELAELALERDGRPVFARAA
jgi:O-acetylserine/cysteine efflux transporter